MSDDFESIRPWLDAIERRGISGFFNRDGSIDGNAVSEKMQLSCWRDAVEHARSVDIGAIRKNLDDPPDFFIELDGVKNGVEFTELVNEAFLRHNEENPDRPWRAEFGDGFVQAQWDIDKFKCHVTNCIEKKGNKYTKNGNFVDVLAVVCGDSCLMDSDVSRWLTDLKFPKFDCIGQVDLVLDYHAGAPGHYPIYRIA